jgi:hypothetical protein
MKGRWLTISQKLLSGESREWRCQILYSLHLTRKLDFIMLINKYRLLACVLLTPVPSFHALRNLGPQDNLCMMIRRKIGSRKSYHNQIGALHV